MTRARDAAVYAGGLLFQQATAFGVAIGAARWLGPHAYGQVSLARAIYGIAVILAPLGLDLSLLRHLGESRADVGRKLGELSALRRIAAGVNVAAAALGALLLGPWLQAHVYRQPGFALDLGLALAALPFAADLAILTAACRAFERVALASAVTLYLQPVLRSLALVALLACGFGAAGMLAATTAGVALADVALAAALRPGRDAGPPVPLAQAAPLFGYSGWMAAMLLTYGALKLADILVLGQARPAAEVGEYAALSSLAQLIGLYPTALSQTLAPRVAGLYAEHDLAGVRRELEAYVRAASLLCAPLLAGLAVFGDWLDLVFGARFRFDPGLALPLALGAYVSGVFGPMAVSLSMTGRHRLEFAVLCCGAALSLAAALGLAPRFGGVGVAWAMLGGYIAVNAVRTAISARLMGGLDIGAADLCAPLACLALALAVRRAAEAFGRHDVATALAAGAVLAAADLALYRLWLLRPGERAELARISRLRWRSGAGAAPSRS